MFKVSEILNIVKNFIFLQTLLHFKVNLIQINQFWGERKSFILTGRLKSNATDQDADDVES